MYFKTVKTIFANRISHTYKEGTASLHVPSLGLWAWAGLGANTGRGAELGAPSPSPGQGGPALTCYTLKAPVQAGGQCQGAPLCPGAHPGQSSVPRSQGYSQPCVEPGAAFPLSSDGTEQLLHKPGYLHPANPAQVQACGTQVKTVHGPFSLSPTPRHQIPDQERAKETSPYLN